MEPHTYQMRIGEGRRVVLPPEVCQSLSVTIGDTIVVRLEEDRATLGSVDRTIDRFQKLLANKVPAGVSLVDELLAERAEVAARE